MEFCWMCEQKWLVANEWRNLRLDKRLPLCRGRMVEPLSDSSEGKTGESKSSSDKSPFGLFLVSAHAPSPGISEQVYLEEQRFGDGMRNGDGSSHRPRTIPGKIPAVALTLCPNSGKILDAEVHGPREVLLGSSSSGKNKSLHLKAFVAGSGGVKKAVQAGKAATGASSDAGKGHFHSSEIDLTDREKALLDQSALVCISSLVLNTEFALRIIELAEKMGKKIVLVVEGDHLNRMDANSEKRGNGASGNSHIDSKLLLVESMIFALLPKIDTVFVGGTGRGGKKPITKKIPKSFDKNSAFLQRLKSNLLAHHVIVVADRERSNLTYATVLGDRSWDLSKGRNPSSSNSSLDSYLAGVLARYMVGEPVEDCVGIGLGYEPGSSNNLETAFVSNRPDGNAKM